jgi:hypothetical protein
VSHCTQVPAQRRRNHFVYGTFTLSSRPFQCRSTMFAFSYSAWDHALPAGRSFNPNGTTLHGYHIPSVWALPLSLAATQRISALISPPRGTEMVQFPRCCFLALCIQTRMTGFHTQPGYPIRPPADLRMFAPPRGLSQLTTAFFANRAPRHPP